MRVPQEGPNTKETAASPSLSLSLSLPVPYYLHFNFASCTEADTGFLYLVDHLAGIGLYILVVGDDLYQAMPDIIGDGVASHDQQLNDDIDVPREGDGELLC